MKIKQLNWRNGIAKTPFGRYSTIGRLGRWHWLFGREVAGIYRTKKLAQAAAQADFERRVRQCFEENDENESLHTDGLTESDLIGGDN